MILVGATGQIIQGDVMDVSIKPFVRALRDHDPYLYVSWNPFKLKGWGCWEIRRRPENMSIRDIITFNGNTYVDLDYVESNMINHVLDCAFLNYDQIRKIKSMDTWLSFGEKGKRFSKEVDDKAIAYADEQRAKIKRETSYVAKQYKKEIQAFREYVQSGHNPSDIARYWNK